MTIITRKHEVAGRYLEYLEREIEMLAERAAGTPHGHSASLGRRNADLSERSRRSSDCTRVIARHFDVQVDAETAIEIDPRVDDAANSFACCDRSGSTGCRWACRTSPLRCRTRSVGISRSALTRDLYDYARSIGFNAINIDLIYGLPRQNVETFTRTLTAVTAMRPDRIAVYSYAHVPWLRPHQKHIDAVGAAVSAIVKLELIGAAIDTFVGAGYMPIGMDHFALADDELAVAARERRLHRNFMGYTTRPCDRHGRRRSVGHRRRLRRLRAERQETVRRTTRAIDARSIPD